MKPDAKDSYGMTRKIRSYPPDQFSHRITLFQSENYWHFELDSPHRLI
jgi:hypothetical protein